MAEGMTKTKSIDEDECKRLLKYGTAQDLINLRARLVNIKRDVESQLADESASMREDRAHYLAQGMHPREADIRASAQSDQDWRVRAAGFQRVCDKYLASIRARLGELQRSVERPHSAVVLSSVNTSKTVAAALNALIEKGCKISSWNVVGEDLVVVGTEPRHE